MSFDAAQLLVFIAVAATWLSGWRREPSWARSITLDALVVVYFALSLIEDVGDDHTGWAVVSTALLVHASHNLVEAAKSYQRQRQTRSWRHQHPSGYHRSPR